MGEQVFGNGIELIDNPFLEYGLGSRSFDGEGRPVQLTKLVEDGRLTQWLLNGPSARQLGLKPNGFASAGFGDPPGIATSNLHLTPGEKSPEELISSAGKVLQITEMFGPSINANTGRHTRGVALGGRGHAFTARVDHAARAAGFQRNQANQRLQ